MQFTIVLVFKRQLCPQTNALIQQQTGRKRQKTCLYVERLFAHDKGSMIAGDMYY